MVGGILNVGIQLVEETQTGCITVGYPPHVQRTFPFQEFHQLLHRDAEEAFSGPLASLGVAFDDARGVVIQPSKIVN